MAFGDVKGTFSTAANSVTDPFDGLADATFSVAVGDLIYVVFIQQTALTVTAFEDSLGNTYTPCNAGNDATDVTARSAYSIVTVAGTFTSGAGFVRSQTTASTNNCISLGVAFEGPFTAIDANPANSVSVDVTSPFVCPSTGTLTQADELIVAWAAANHNTAYTADAPNLERIELATATIAKGVIGSQVVAVTTAVAPSFSAAANPTQNILGTTSFAKDTSVPKNAFYEEHNALAQKKPLARAAFVAAIAAGAFASFQPQGSVTSTTQVGGYGDMPAVFVRPTVVVDQSTVISKVEIVSNSQDDGYFGYQFDYKFAKPLAVTKQQFAYFQPQDVVTTSNVGGFSDFPTVFRLAEVPKVFTTFLQEPVVVDNTTTKGYFGYQFDYKFIRSFKAAEQSFAYFQPQGAIVAPVTDGWRSYQYSYQFKKIIVSHQYTAFVPPAALVLQGGWSDFPDVVATSYPVSLQQFNALRLKALETVSNSVDAGYQGYQLDYAFTKPFKAAEQRFDYFQPQGAIAVAAPQGGYQPVWGIKFVKPLPASLAPYEAFRLPPVTAVVSGWQSFQFDYVFKKLTLAARQQFSISLKELVVDNTTTKGYFGYQLSYAFAKPLAASQQQFGVFVREVIAEENTTTKGYFGYQFDYKFTKPFKAAKQRFAYFQPQGSITGTISVGGFADFPTVFRQPDVLQQFAYFQPQGTITVTPTTPWGWDSSQFKLAVNYTVISAVPMPMMALGPLEQYGYQDFQFDYKFAKPLIAARQQFSAFIKEQVAPDNTTTKGYFGYQLSYAFVKPFKAAEQRFAYFQPRGDIVQALTPVGGYADFPGIIITPTQPPPFGFLPTFRPVDIVYKEGWRGFQFDLAFNKPKFPAKLQQYNFYPIYKAENVIAEAHPGWEGYQFSVAFTPPFPVTEQQFNYFQPQGEIISIITDIHTRFYISNVGLLMGIR